MSKTVGFSLHNSSTNWATKRSEKNQQWYIYRLVSSLNELRTEMIYTIKKIQNIKENDKETKL